jgi:predicted CoA-binding protein
MPTLKEAAQDFLALRRIAVAGVSRHADVAANAIYKRLRTAGYQVFPINPNAEEVEGDRCYPNLAAIPGGVDGVVIATHPGVTARLVRECSDLGIKRVWMHRAFGQGSVDTEAVRLCRELGLAVIPGSCPMMFCEPVDVGHRCIRWISRVTGGQAQPQGYA